MKQILAFLILALPMAAQTPSYGTTAQSGALIDHTNATKTMPVKSGLLSAAPGSCTANKEFYVATDQAAGSKLRQCNSAGTGWDVVGPAAGGGGSGSVFVVNMTQTTLAASTTNAVYGTVGLTTAQNTSSTWSRVSMPAPAACTLKNLFVSMGAAQASGGTLAITAFVNGADTALTCAVAAGGTTCNDTTHTVSIAQGDLVAVHAANNSSTGASTYFNVSAVCQ